MMQVRVGISFEEGGGVLGVAQIHLKAKGWGREVGGKGKGG